MSGSVSGLLPGVGVRRARVVPTAKLALALTIVCLIGLPSHARGADVQTFDLPTPDAGLSQIVAGPDGGLWFTEQNAFAVGRITTAGVITRYPVPQALFSVQGDGPGVITRSGGSVWILTDVGASIDQISATGVVFERYADLDQPATNLAADGRGGVWATSLEGAGGGSVAGGLFRVDPPKGAVTNYRSPTFGGQFSPVPIIAAAHGGAWFADGGAAIKRISPAGKVVAYPIDGSGSRDVTSMALDRRGDLWFTEYVPGGGFAPSTQGAIGEIAAGANSATPLELPGNRAPGSLVLGPDGGLWFAWARGIGRISIRTGEPQFVTLPAAERPAAIAFGSDHQLWYVDPAANQIGRIDVSQLPIGALTPLPRPVVTLAPRTLPAIVAGGRLTATCRLASAATCTVTISVSGSVAHRLKLEGGHTRPLKLATASRTRTRAGTAQLPLRLPAAVLQALRGRSTLTVSLQARSTIATGRSQTITRTVRLAG